MKNFTETELEVTKELLNISLANAADAFSKMANERVLFSSFDLEVLRKDEIKSLLSDVADNGLYVLTTEVKGKLEGISYLIFDKKDAEGIFPIFAPNQANISEEGTLSEFQQAILMEVDNILAAAMVTQLSNFLDLFVYGDVPNYKLLNKSELTDLLANDHDIYYEVALNLKAKLETSKSDISPTFIWFFKNDFVDAVKNIVDTKKKMYYLKTQNNF
jgi:chemotaxis protein CheY-P-specific phosphatase CheC